MPAGTGVLVGTGVGVFTGVGVLVGTGVGVFTGVGVLVGVGTGVGVSGGVIPWNMEYREIGTCLPPIGPHTTTV